MSNLEEKADKILDMIISGLEKTGEVINEQAPEIINEYITYSIIDAFPATHIVAVFSSMSFIFLVFFLTRKIEDFDHKWMPRAFIGVICLIVFCFSLGGTLDGLKKMYKIKEAPKAYLIEKFRGKTR